MPRYVALLRGVSPSNCKMPQLRECFQAAGFDEVRTVLSSGNVVFSTRDSTWTTLEREAEQAMLASLGHAFPTIVRPTEYLQGLVASDPFAEFALPPTAKRVVTFLRRPENPGPELPLERDGARILKAGSRRSVHGVRAGSQGARLHDAARAHVWKGHHHPDAGDGREVRPGVAGPDEVPDDPRSPAPASRPLRCWLMALLSGWVTMVFLSSALIVLLGVPNAMTRSGVGHPGAIPATWRVADEMAPAAKLLLVALFAALLWLGERWSRAGAPRHVPPSRWTPYAVNVALGVAAMALTLALVPAAFSRGFGVGLTGARFDPAVLPLYLVSSALGAVVYTVSLIRCRARHRRPAP